MVHLAAVPAPGRVADHLTFMNNMGCTWNVFSAARRAGVTNIVWASSETVLGLPFDTPPPYIPVDEGYPPRPESTYSLVKTLEEAMAVQLCRWNPDLKMIGLRFSNVMEPADYARFPAFNDDPGSRKWNLWGYIDARDGAQAVRLALESDLTGTEIFIIANADTVTSRPNAALVKDFYPDVEVRGDLGEHQTLLSIEKARRLLGYQPVEPSPRGGCGYGQGAGQVTTPQCGRQRHLRRWPSHRLPDESRGDVRAAAATEGYGLDRAVPADQGRHSVGC